MLYRAEKPSLATAMSVWKDRDSRPEDDWISGGIFVPQYRPIRGATADVQIKPSWSPVVRLLGNIRSLRVSFSGSFKADDTALTFVFAHYAVSL